MKKILNISFRNFCKLFFGIFVVEYSLPIVNSFVLASSLGMDSNDLFSNRQFIKHIFRLPIYGLFYFWTLKNINNKYGLWLWRFLIWSHIIFKSLTTFIVLCLLVQKQLIRIDSPVNILNIAFIILMSVVYLYFWQYIELYVKSSNLSNQIKNKVK